MQESSIEPGTPDLLPVSDTGLADNDNVTALNNTRATTALSFTVNATVLGATITLLADGITIASATALSQTTIITTDGQTILTDGPHTITVRQTDPGKAQSAASVPLVITIDTTDPSVTGVSINGTNWAGRCADT